MEVTKGSFVCLFVSLRVEAESFCRLHRLMLGFAGIPSLIQFVVFFFMPESPRWLMMKGREEQAFLVLLQIRGDTRSAKSELEDIRSSQEAQKQQRRMEAGKAPLNHSTSLSSEISASDGSTAKKISLDRSACSNQRKLTLSHLDRVNWPSASSIQPIDHFDDEESACQKMMRVLRTPSTRKALLIGSSLQLIQQLCGINTIMYYSATIIQMSGKVVRV
jgi:hypothetical protein